MFQMIGNNPEYIRYLNETALENVYAACFEHGFSLVIQDGRITDCIQEEK